MQYKYTLTINGEEVVHVLTDPFNGTSKIVTHGGHQISMKLDYDGSLFHSNCMVTVLIDGVPSYKKVFKNLSGLYLF